MDGGLLMFSDIPIDDLAPDVWHLVVVVCDDGALTTYIDGEEVTP